MKNNLKDRTEPFQHIPNKNNNPFPYLKAYDLNVQPSLYEGKAVAIG
jgi:hypothetical protein